MPLPLDLFEQLSARYPRGVSSVLEHVARDFLERTEEDWNAPRPARTDGVRWDAVFLPNGTRLRTRYFGEYKYAEVKGDEIVFEGKSIASVSQLARMMRGDTSNNAWLVMEVQRPGDSVWIKADRLRRK